MLVGELEVVVRQVARYGPRKKIKSLGFLRLMLLFSRIFTVGLFDFGHLEIVFVYNTGDFLNFLHQRL